MASIVKRTISDGSTTFQVRWREGRRQRSTVAAGDTDREREANARRIKKLIDAHGTYRDEMARPGVPTVNEQAEVFLSQHTRGNADTVRDYRRIIDQHIAPAFGDLSVTALTTPMLSAWARTLARHDGKPGPVSDKTRANVTAVINGIIESAVPEHLPSNPWRKVRLPKTDGPRERHFLTSADFGLILGEVPEHYRMVVLVLAMTGLRWGEAAALLVGDLDLSSGLPVIKVTKALKHGHTNSDPAGVPKTEKAVRIVTAPVELADVLRAVVGDRPPTEPLLPTVRGKRLRNSTFHTLVWQPSLNRAQDKGLAFRPKIRELRNAAVTWLIEAGMRPDEVADLMGHEDIATTMQIYRRSNPQAGRKASAAMSGVLSEVFEARAIET